MKRSLLLGAALAAALVSNAALAATPAPAARDQAPALQLAHPVYVVHPTGLPASFKNTVVRVTMTLDANGIPHDVAADGYLPRDVAKRLLPVVAQWRFSPVRENGRAVTARVILPIELSENS